LPLKAYGGVCQGKVRVLPSSYATFGFAFLVLQASAAQLAQGISPELLGNAGRNLCGRLHTPSSACGYWMTCAFLGLGSLFRTMPEDLSLGLCAHVVR